MARSGVTALSLAVLLALMELGSCLRCYQCNSVSDSSCEDSPSKKSIVDCEKQDSSDFNKKFLGAMLPDDISTLGTTKLCHKIVLETGIVTRTCLQSNAYKVDLTCTAIKTAGKATIKHCSACDTDECNAAGSIASSLPLAGLALLVTYLYSKR